MNTLLTQSILADARERRAAGEGLKTIAAEVGVTWQRLDKALRHGLREQTDEPATLHVSRAGPGPLVEKYRPTRLAALFGQERVVSLLRRFVASPYPCAFLFEGETGTGKTSAALALAAELGCAVDQQEFGGVWIIASGEQTADAVRDTCSRMWNRPFYGSGWKVVIVNEADRMHPAAETVWLDRLENIPQRSVVIFTTNHPDRLSQRFRDRCVRMAFESDADKLLRSTRSMLTAIWKAETATPPEATLIEQLAEQASEDGRLSFRRAVQLLQPHLMERSGS